MALRTDFTITAVILSALDTSDAKAVDAIVEQLSEHAPIVSAASGADAVGHIRVVITVQAGSLAEAFGQAFELLDPIGLLVQLEVTLTSRYEDLHPPIGPAEPHPWHCTCRHCLAARVRHPLSTQAHRPS